MKALHRALREEERERGGRAVAYGWAKDVVEVVFDLAVVDVDVDPYELATRLEAVDALVGEITARINEAGRPRWGQE